MIIKADKVILTKHGRGTAKRFIFNGADAAAEFLALIKPGGGIGFRPQSPREFFQIQAFNNFEGFNNSWPTANLRVVEEMIFDGQLWRRLESDLTPILNQCFVLTHRPPVIRQPSVKRG